MEAYADSFYWIALLNDTDQHHLLVRQTKFAGRLVISVAVQLEVLDAFSKNAKLRSYAKYFWDYCSTDDCLVLVPLENVLLQEAMRLFQSCPDKTWSFTDCISFVIMQQRKIKLALTADQHFRQAGFEIAFHVT
jgi:predicted nucleic acid-binding protein